MTPEAAATKYPKLFKIAEDGILEIYADNHILSGYRKCPGYFQEFILNNLSTVGRNWSLEFGQYFHKCMEYFYKAQKEEWKGFFQVNSGIAVFWEGVLPWRVPQNLENFIKLATNFWLEYDLNIFGDHPSCKKLGGFTGAFNLFLQYYNTHFQQERLRVVGTELSFGRAKEVPITRYDFDNLGYKFRAFYCGRIDLVVDDGSIIGPMDHKTTSYFDGTESSKFKPHDGMQGYVYAFQKMTPQFLVEQGRVCNSIFINHVSLGYKKEQGERFKRSIKSYTPAEMEEWRLRQVRTFTDIYRTVILEEPIYWDTERCNSWYGFSDCPYKELHELPPMSREVLAKTKYVQLEQWSHDRA